jgi:DeoR family transcriptional regulator, suf operon transcriptional repressor
MQPPNTYEGPALRVHSVYNDLRYSIKSRFSASARFNLKRRRFAFPMLRQQLLDTSRGRIVTLLQRGALTVDAIASQLELTPNAVRAQLTGMERDGVVRRAGRRAGTTRPSHVFELTPEVEQLLSQAYVPFLTELVRLFADAVPPAQVDRLMRDVGKALATELPFEKRPSASIRSRVAAASELLNKQLGALTHVEGDGGYTIRGVTCPLAALTGKHPAVCLAIESLLAEILGVAVRECCDRTGRPKCCFEISAQINRPDDEAPRKRVR